MKIVFKETFIIRLENQIEYIAKDSPTRARKFKNDLFRRLKELPTNPFKNRKSIYFEEESVRDLIFKGYTIVYRIIEVAIEVFGFVKQQNKPTDD
jgi:plasmid stabilization system protein ParE